MARLNNIEPSIGFTSDIKKNNNTLPFLEILIINDNNKL